MHGRLRLRIRVGKAGAAGQELVCAYACKREPSARGFATLCTRRSADLSLTYDFRNLDPDHPTQARVMSQRLVGTAIFKPSTVKIRSAPASSARAAVAAVLIRPAAITAVSLPTVCRIKAMSSKFTSVSS